MVIIVPLPKNQIPQRIYKGMILIYCIQLR